MGMSIWSGVGNLTADPEMTYTKNGIPLLKMAIAANQYINGKTEPTYINCVLWGKLAESKVKFLSRGKEVSASGQFIQERWTDSNGQKRERFYVNLSSLEPTSGGGRESRDSGYGGNDSGYSQQAQKPVENKGYDGQTFDDDIPF
jgi:single-strand DNA-binding protein